MSLDLGTHHWSYVGSDGGFALVTHLIDQKSRWIDLRTWPGTFLQIRDEWTRTLCPGATLAGWKAQTVYTQDSPTKKRHAIKLPPGVGYRAIGYLASGVCVVPGFLGVDNRAAPLSCAQAPMIHEGTWRALAGKPGGDTPASAIVGALVVWHGRVFLYEGGQLVETHAGELPRGATSFCGDREAMYCAAGGKLVCITRDGQDRDDYRIGKLSITGVMQYEDALLVGDGRKVWRYDPSSREHAAFDIIDHDALITAPCGLVALVDSGRYLVRARV